MRDELYDRDYQAGRNELHDGIDRLVRRVADFLRVTFEAMHRIEWSALWASRRRRTIPRGSPDVAWLTGHGLLRKQQFVTSSLARQGALTR